MSYNPEDPFNFDEDLDDTTKDDGKDTKPDEITIPKARYDAEVNKLRAELAQAKASTAQAKQTPPAPDPLLALESELETAEDVYETHLLNGDKDAAKLARATIRELRGKINHLQLSSTTQTVTSATTEATQFQATVAEFERTYPALDSNSPKFNEALTDDVLALMAGYVQRGDTRSAALKKAVAKLVPAPSNAKAQERGLNARTAAIDAARRQPPSRPGIGGVPTADDFDVDVAGLTREDIAKMDARKISVLRGDYVE